MRAAENIERRAKTLTFRQVALTLIAVVPVLIFFIAYFVFIKGLWTVIMARNSAAFVSFLIFFVAYLLIIKSLWTLIRWLSYAGIKGWEPAKTINRKDR